MATGHFQGEGGVIWEMDLPLPEAIQDQVTKGYLRPVNPDGSPVGEAEPVKRPAANASKAEWVGYAVRKHDLDPDEAEGLTKQDLIELG